MIENIINRIFFTYPVFFKRFKKIPFISENTYYRNYSLQLLFIDLQIKIDDGAYIATESHNLQHDLYVIIYRETKNIN